MISGLRTGKGSVFNRWRSRLLVVLILAVCPLPDGYANPGPRHVVSLDMCTDWLLLNSASDALQVTYSPNLYRFAADWVPDGMPVHNGSLEQLIQLDPDLVISGEFNAAVLRRRLQQLDYRVKVLRLPTNLSQLKGYVEGFQRVIGTGNTGFPEIEPVPSSGKRLLLLGANGIGTGRQTLEHDILLAAGWRNYLRDDGYLNLDLEALIIDPPDAVLQVMSEAPALANLFAGHPALKQGIDQINRSEGAWRWRCPGPWTLSLVEDLKVNGGLRD